MQRPYRRKKRHRKQRKHNGTLLHGTIAHLQRIPADPRLYVRGLHSGQCFTPHTARALPEGAGGMPDLPEYPDDFGHHAVGLQRYARHCAGEGGRTILHLRLAVHRKRGGDGAPSQEPQGGLCGQRVEPDAGAYAGRCTCAQGEKRLLYGRHYGERAAERQASRHRHEPRLPGQPDVRGYEGARLHDAA